MGGVLDHPREREPGRSRQLLNSSRITGKMNHHHGVDPAGTLGSGRDGRWVRHEGGIPDVHEDGRQAGVDDGVHGAAESHRGGEHLRPGRSRRARKASSMATVQEATATPWSAWTQSATPARKRRPRVLSSPSPSGGPEPPPRMPPRRSPYARMGSAACRGRLAALLDLDCLHPDHSGRGGRPLQRGQLGKQLSGEGAVESGVLLDALFQAEGRSEPEATERLLPSTSYEIWLRISLSV